MRAFTCKSDICFDFMQVGIGQLVFFVYTSTSNYLGNGASKDEWVGGIPQKSLINKMSFQCKFTHTSWCQPWNAISSVYTHLTMFGTSISTKRSLAARSRVVAQFFSAFVSGSIQY